MIRSRTATFTLALLALGCSSQSSAPGSAHGSANVRPVSSDRAAPERRAEEPAAMSAEEAELDGAAPEPAAAAPSGASMKAKESARSPSRLTIAEPMTSGGLDRDIIRRKAQDHEADIQACTDGLTGSLAVKLEVDARGAVKDVKLGGDSSVDDQAVVDCILALVSKWSFAGEATGKASVELRLELGD